MTHWLTILEAVTLAASLLGLLLSTLTHEMLYALVPIVFSLFLNQWNRRQADRRNRQGAIAALRRVHQELLDEIQKLQQTLQRQSLDALSPVKSSQDIELAIAQIQVQNSHLDASLSRVVRALNELLPTPVELSETQASSQPLPPGESSIAQAIVGDFEVTNPLLKEALRWHKSKSFIAHEGWVSAIALSPDDQYLVTGGNDRQIRLWHTQTGECLGHCLSPSPISALAFSPDGKTLASGTYAHRIHLWSVAEKSLIQTLEGHQGAIQTLLFVTDPHNLDRCLVSGSYDQTLRFWDLEAGESEILVGHDGRVQCLALHSAQWRLISGGEDGRITSWKLPDGELIDSLDRGDRGIMPGKAVEALTMDGEGHYLAAGYSDGSLRLWQLEDQRLLYTLEAHTGPVAAVVITPDRQILLSGGADGRLKLWQFPTGTALGNLAEPVDSVLNLVLSRDGEFLVSSHPAGRVQFWKHQEHVEDM